MWLHQSSPSGEEMPPQWWHESKLRMEGQWKAQPLPTLGTIALSSPCSLKQLLSGALQETELLAFSLWYGPAWLGLLCLCPTIYVQLPHHEVASRLRHNHMFLSFQWGLHWRHARSSCQWAGILFVAMWGSMCFENCCWFKVKSCRYISHITSYCHII